jgi:hypothetical protein
MSTHAKTRHNVVLLSILAFVALAIGAIVAVTPSQKNTTLPGPQQAVNSQVGLVLPLVPLEGDWSVKDNDLAFVAKVEGTSIKIEMLSGDGMSVTYWHGTFKTAESPNTTIVSTKTEADDEIVLVRDLSKDFQIGMDGITFKFSALGFSKIVTLKR